MNRHAVYFFNFLYNNNILHKIIDQDTKWIHNILDSKSEHESILFENEHFVLLPDPKWDYQNVDELIVFMITMIDNDCIFNELPYELLELILIFIAG